MELIEEVRNWLIQQKVGLLSDSELMTLVDSKIVELEEPPDFLTTISLKEKLDRIPKLDLFMYKLSNEECSRTAKQILKAFNAGNASFTDVGLYTFNVCQLLNKDDPLFELFDWVNDEVHLVNEGVKDQKQSTIDIVKTLEKIARYNKAPQPTPKSGAAEL